MRRQWTFCGLAIYYMYTSLVVLRTTRLVYINFYQLSMPLKAGTWRFTRAGNRKHRGALEGRASAVTHRGWWSVFLEKRLLGDGAAGCRSARASGSRLVGGPNGRSQTPRTGFSEISSGNGFLFHNPDRRAAVVLARAGALTAPRWSPRNSRTCSSFRCGL